MDAQASSGAPVVDKARWRARAIRVLAAATRRRSQRDVGPIIQHPSRCVRAVRSKLGRKSHHACEDKGTSQQRKGKAEQRSVVPISPASVVTTAFSPMGPQERRVSRSLDSLHCEWTLLTCESSDLPLVGTRVLAVRRDMRAHGTEGAGLHAHAVRRQEAVPKV